MNYQTAKRCAFKGLFFTAGIALGAVSIYTLTKYGGELKEQFDTYYQTKQFTQKAKVDYRLDNLVEINKLNRDFYKVGEKHEAK